MSHTTAERVGAHNVDQTMFTHPHLESSGSKSIMEQRIGKLNQAGNDRSYAKRMVNKYLKSNIGPGKLMTIREYDNDVTIRNRVGKKGDQDLTYTIHRLVDIFEFATGVRTGPGGFTEPAKRRSPILLTEGMRKLLFWREEVIEYFKKNDAYSKQAIAKLNKRFHLEDLWIVLTFPKDEEEKEMMKDYLLDLVRQPDRSSNKTRGDRHREILSLLTENPPELKTLHKEIFPKNGVVYDRQTENEQADHFVDDSVARFFHSLPKEKMTAVLNRKLLGYYDKARLTKEILEKSGLSVLTKNGHGLRVILDKPRELHTRPVTLKISKIQDVRLQRLLKWVVVGETVRRWLVEKNQGLISSVIRDIYRTVYWRYARHGGEYLDMHQNGSLGLIRAIEHYDPKKDFEFSTYAHDWIMEAIQRGSDADPLLSGIPVRLGQQMKRYTENRNLFIQKNHRDPTDIELSNAMGISMATFRKLLQKQDATHNISLSRADDEEDDMWDSRLLIQSREESPHQNAERTEEAEFIQQVIEQAELTYREKYVLFAFAANVPRSIIAKRIGRTGSLARMEYHKARAKFLRAYNLLGAYNLTK